MTVPPTIYAFYISASIIIYDAMGNAILIRFNEDIIWFSFSSCPCCNNKHTVFAPPTFLPVRKTASEASAFGLSEPSKIHCAPPPGVTITRRRIRLFPLSWANLSCLGPVIWWPLFFWSNPTVRKQALTVALMKPAENTYQFHKSNQSRRSTAARCPFRFRNFLRQFHTFSLHWKGNHSFVVDFFLSVF